MSTLYASFSNPAAAERAAGALLDHGARAEDVTILANESYAAARTAHGEPADQHAEHVAKQGLSTTTPADAAMGAAKGTVAGLGVGALAALVALAVPGVGIVIGGGALATAVAGAISTAVAGAAAGGVAGYLKDQGVGEEMTTHYSDVFSAGGSILGVAVPTGDLGATEVEQLLAKYGASNIATANAPRTLAEPANVEHQTLTPANPNLDPMVVERPVVAPGARIEETTFVDPNTPGPNVSHTVVERTPSAEPIVPVIQPTTIVDAATGEERHATVAVNPVTGTVVPPAEPATTLGPTGTSGWAPPAHLHTASGDVVSAGAVDPSRLVTDPRDGATVAPAEADPLTGNVRPATVVETSPAIVHSNIRATIVDASGHTIEGYEIDPATGTERLVRWEGDRYVPVSTSPADRISLE